MPGTLWVTGQTAEETFAEDLYKRALELLAKTERTAEENERMFYAAYAARHHAGGLSDKGKLARAEWLISRVCATLRRGHLAEHHAAQSLDICEDNAIREVCLARAYEAKARAAMILKKRDDMVKFRRLAERTGAQITDAAERAAFDSDLAAIPVEKLPHEFLSDELLRTRLAACPDIAKAVAELFTEAKASSEQRFYLAVLDVSRYYMPNGPTVNNEFPRFWVIVQYAKFMRSVLMDPKEHDQETADFLRYLQILAYSQFWELAGIQRLLWSLSKIANGKSYGPRLLLDNEVATGNVWNHVVQEAAKRQLQIADVIRTIYHNVIRNDFVHSNFLIQLGSISSSPSLEGGEDCFNANFQTWDDLFGKLRDFVDALFQHRRDAEAELDKLQPYSITVPDFRQPFFLKRDQRGYWIAVKET